MPAVEMRSRTLFAAVAALAVAAGASWTTAGTASADPAAPPLPIDIAQAPGLPAIQQLSPILQQAAANPDNAASMLIAAASAFAGNSSAPADSRQVASSVNEFVQQPAGPGGLPIKLPANLNLPGNLNQLLPAGAAAPAAQNPAAPTNPVVHVPAVGAEPGAVPHLPSGVDPAYVVGPATGEALAPAPGAAPDPAPPPTPSEPQAPAAAPAAFGPDAPPTQEFMYPSIGNGCLADGGNAIATAMSVAGPASIPKPGTKAGQTAYVFTAIGTPGPAPEQKLPLNVTWVNLTNGKSGSATLKPNPEINPNGPTTLVAIADTGSGSIMSTIFGQVTTVEKQCTFLPTIGSTVVP